MLRVIAGIWAVLWTLCANATHVHVESSTVFVNQVPVFTLRANVAGQPPSVRATKIASTIQGLSAGSDITIQSNRKEAKVLADGKVVVRVNSSEAKANGTTPSSLAKAWADRLRYAQGLPPLLLKSDDLVLPVGKKAFVSLVGSEAHRAKFEVDAKDTVGFQLDHLGFTVAAKAKGIARIRVSFGEEEVILSVAVLPYSANLNQPLQAKVVGFPATIDIVRSAAANAITNHLKTEPGANIIIKSLRARSIPGGRTVAIEAGVRVEAPNAFPAEGKIVVQVANTGAIRPREGELWYSNDPENVEQEGQLFMHSLETMKPARLLYHHVNQSNYQLVFAVTIENTSDEPATVAVIIGDGKPNKDPVRVGAEAGQRFIQHWATGSGEILEIPAKSRIPISIRRLGHNYTASGITYLRLEKGGPSTVLVRAQAIHPYRLNARWNRAADILYPWAISGAAALSDTLIEVSGNEHIYPQPFKSLTASYKTGGRFAFARIGQEPIANATQSKLLAGNYGVLYQVRFDLENPTNLREEVEIVFEPSAGYSAAVFLVDGVVRQTPVLDADHQYIIKQLKLEPGSKVQFSLQTMPLSGSSYPATIVVRPKDALSAQH